MNLYLYVMSTELPKNILNFVENGGVALAAHDQFMKIKWCNASFVQMFKYEDSMIGMTLFDICPRELDRVSRFVNKFRKGSSSKVSTSLNMRTGGGSNRYVVVNSEKFLLENGEIDEIISHFRDDTKRMIREDRVKTALESSSHVSKNRGVFVSKIVHELRSPITALLLCTDEDSEGMAHSLSLSRKIKNMTYATKFEMGEIIVPNETPTCLQTLLVDAIKGAKTGFVEDIDVIIHSIVLVNGQKTDCMVSVALDEVLLFTVLSELIRNCCSLSGVLVKVTSDFNTSTQKLFISVEDNGKGIDMSKVLRIFNSFWGETISNDIPSVTDTMTTDSSGIGIGLNICYNIVQCMDSMLEFKTSSSGTSFFFTIDTSSAKVGQYGNTIPSDVLYNWSGMNNLPIEPQTIRNPIDMGRSADDNSTAATNDSSIPVSNIQGSSNPTSSMRAFSTPASTIHTVQESSDTVSYMDKIKQFVKIAPPAPPAQPDIHRSLRTAPVLSFTKGSSKGKSSAGTGTSDGFQPHILIVDDQTIVRKLCGRMLRNMGCTFETASNGALAVDKVSNQNEYFYDLILMDLRMPLMNGMDAARVIVNDLKLTVPIVAFTAEDSVEVFKEALDCGIVGFLHKPATQKDIEYTIEKYSRRI